MCYFIYIHLSINLSSIEKMAHLIPFLLKLMMKKVKWFLNAHFFMYQRNDGEQLFMTSKYR